MRSIPRILPEDLIHDFLNPATIFWASIWAILIEVWKNRWRPFALLLVVRMLVLWMPLVNGYFDLYLYFMNKGLIKGRRIRGSDALASVAGWHISVMRRIVK